MTTDERTGRRYTREGVCPWCRQGVYIDAAGFLDFHPEPREDWARRPPECVGAGLPKDVVQDLANAREEAGGPSFHLRAHP